MEESARQDTGQIDTKTSLDLPGQRELYRLMVLTQRIDREATALQRQGELAVWAPLEGQEAAQVGSAYALEPSDFAFPSYREMGAALVRGVDVVDYVHFYRATWHGGMWDPTEYNFAPVSVPVASQTLHAVGWAMGAKKDGKDACALAYFGDGATSEGDFHEACNFAAVFKAPVIFFCQNNQWAISVPLEKQTTVPIHEKAKAYGFPGIRVDGNDVVAVYEATREARRRAIEDGTPTLIEAVTYRIGPHSTADDASKYRSAEEVQGWKDAEPVGRYREHLTTNNLADDAFFESVAAEADELAAHLRAGIVGADAPPLSDLFEWVYHERPQHLERQREEMLREAGDA